MRVARGRGLTRGEFIVWGDGFFFVTHFFVWELGSMVGNKGTNPASFILSQHVFLPSTTFAHFCLEPVDLGVLRLAPGVFSMISSITLLRSLLG